MFTLCYKKGQRQREKAGRRGRAIKGLEERTWVKEGRRTHPSGESVNTKGPATNL